MRCVVADFVEEVVFLWRCSVRVGCCVFRFVIDEGCRTGIMRACGWVNEVVAIE